MQEEERTSLHEFNKASKNVGEQTSDYMKQIVLTYLLESGNSSTFL